MIKAVVITTQTCLHQHICLHLHSTACSTCPTYHRSAVHVDAVRWTRKELDTVTQGSDIDGFCRLLFRSGRLANAIHDKADDEDLGAGQLQI